MVYLDIQNAYNFQNEGQDYIIRDTNADGTFKTTEDGADYILLQEPNVSGTLLPTVGIMIKL